MEEKRTALILATWKVKIDELVMDFYVEKGTAIDKELALTILGPRGIDAIALWEAMGSWTRLTDNTNIISTNSGSKRALIPNEIAFRTRILRLLEEKQILMGAREEIDKSQEKSPKKSSKKIKEKPDGS